MQFLILAPEFFILLCAFNFRDLNSGFRDGLNEFLKARGIGDELSAFLHEFMMNKDRIEAIGWLRKIESFVEK